MLNSSRIKKIKIYFFCILICVFVGVLSGFFTKISVNEWYDQLIKPSFTPPKWMFAPVWMLLYLMMGISWALVNSADIDKDKLNKANLYFFLQLLFNFLWSVFYFGIQNISLAFIDIIFLIISIIFTIRAFLTVSTLSGLLLIPYLFWVVFACVLNASIWVLNI